VYATALAWVFPLSLAADFGLGTLITREVAAAPGSASDYLRSAAAARLWLGGALMLLLMFAAPFLSSNPAVVLGLQISAPLIVILPSFGGFTAVFRARQDMWPIAWLNLGMLGAQVALTALVFWWAATCLRPRGEYVDLVGSTHHGVVDIPAQA
jgi:O-antigen/teichoic acid export membrane protein